MNWKVLSVVFEILLVLGYYYLGQEAFLWTLAGWMVFLVTFLTLAMSGISIGMIKVDVEDTPNDKITILKHFIHWISITLLIKAGFVIGWVAIPIIAWISITQLMTFAIQKGWVELEDK